MPEVTAPYATNRSEKSFLAILHQKLQTAIPESLTSPEIVELNEEHPPEKLGEMFEENSLDGIIMMDQLGSIEDPGKFFSEVERCLKPGGRLAMIEPGLSLIGWLGYTLSRKGRIDISRPPLEARSRNKSLPNFATASHIYQFLEHRIDFAKKYPELRFIHQEWVSILSGPLSRGIQGMPLIPESMVHPLVALEHSLMPFIGRWMATKMMLVIEKAAK